MITDEREETLREVAALGNVKAVQHFINAGVNVNSQNKMNGWTALHWASHRGQEQIVRILLSNGANPAIETHKGQTALDLAAQKYPQVAEMLKEVTPADRTAAAPEPELPIVPKYLKEPDLEKSWLHPDEFSDARPASRPVSTETQNEQQKQEVEQEREILVYVSSRTDENILGSVYLKNEPIHVSIETMKQELDGVPENFALARHNGRVLIPISSKQMEKRLLDLFRSDEDVLVLIPK